jgi:hypothetical protein
MNVCDASGDWWVLSKLTRSPAVAGVMSPAQIAKEKSGAKMEGVLGFGA